GRGSAHGPQATPHAGPKSEIVRKAFTLTVGFPRARKVNDVNDLNRRREDVMPWQEPERNKRQHERPRRRAQVCPRPSSQTPAASRSRRAQRHELPIVRAIRVAALPEAARGHGMPRMTRGLRTKPTVPRRPISAWRKTRSHLKRAKMNWSKGRRTPVSPAERSAVLLRRAVAVAAGRTAASPPPAHTEVTAPSAPTPIAMRTSYRSEGGPSCDSPVLRRLRLPRRKA